MNPNERNGIKLYEWQNVNAEFVTRDIIHI